MNDLSLGLRDEVSKLLISDEIQKNKLFQGVPSGPLALFIKIICFSTFMPGEVMASEGDVGTAMYIIKEGTARKDHVFDMLGGR